MKKIIRSSTIPLSLNVLLKGQLKFLASHFDVIGLSSKGEDLEEVTKREGISTIAVDMERGISPFKDLVSLFKLYRQIKKEKPLIIHSITPKAGLLSMLAGKMAGVPIRIHTFTGLIFPTRTGILQKILIKMDQLLCWAATNIYPEGRGVKEDLIAYNITNKHLKVLANGNVNGIDTAVFAKEAVETNVLEAVRINLQLEHTDFVFVFVGRLVGDKGINELVQAFDALQSQTTRTIKLLLVGPLETALDPLHQTTVDLMESNSNIISVGFQKDVRPYFAVSDALVFPSYREGFPNVVMQAGAMGLPSIVSNINGCNEIVVEGQNGLIIPVKDSNAIEHSMLRLLNDTELYTSLKANSRKMITDRYEQRVVWQAILTEYQMLLAKHETHSK